MSRQDGTPTANNENAMVPQDIARRRFLDALKREMSRFRSYLGAEKIEVKRAPGWVTGALN
jgi:hypothetical protein